MLNLSPKNLPTLRNYSRDVPKSDSACLWVLPVTADQATEAELFERRMKL